MSRKPGMLPPVPTRFGIADTFFRRNAPAIAATAPPDVRRDLIIDNWRI